MAFDSPYLRPYYSIAAAAGKIDRYVDGEFQAGEE